MYLRRDIKRDIAVARRFAGVYSDKQYNEEAEYVFTAPLEALRRVGIITKGPNGNKTNYEACRSVEADMANDPRRVYKIRSGVHGPIVVGVGARCTEERKDAKQYKVGVPKTEAGGWSQPLAGEYSQKVNFMYRVFSTSKTCGPNPMDIGLCLLRVLLSLHRNDPSVMQKVETAIGLVERMEHESREVVWAVVDKEIFGLVITVHSVFDSKTKKVVDEQMAVLKSLCG